jgi:hypothetical protein
MAKIELLPCPFCGSSDIEILHRECHVAGIDAEGYCAECCHCGTSQTLYCISPEYAAKMWNNRAVDVPGGVSSESLLQVARMMKEICSRTEDCGDCPFWEKDNRDDSHSCFFMDNQGNVVLPYSWGVKKEDEAK